MKRADAEELLNEANPKALFADGFDDAIAGIARRCGQPALVVYEYELCMWVLERQGMTRDEAEEYFEFNVVGSWNGPHTPLFLYMGDGPWDGVDYSNPRYDE